MESTEIAETIHGGEEAEEHRSRTDTGLRRFAGIYLGVIAMLLAITTLGGANATKVMLNANIQASDTYSYYQSKYLRQVALEHAADQLELQLAAQPGMPEAARTKFVEAIKSWRGEARHYESDPQKGQGKKELLAKARQWEEKRDRAAERDPNFDFAEALFQIAIVLGSVSIVAVSRALLRLSGALAVVATVLMINGYFLVVHLPFG